MKIAAIFTGGTIGCRVQENGYLSLGEPMHYTLLEMYQHEYPDSSVLFEPSEPMQILSESMDGMLLTKLIRRVWACLCDTALDGIVILHGSDTLAYTAAILGYLVDTKSIPVVLVSSAFPLSDARANGLVNLHGAVRLIQSRCGGGVFVSNRNDGDEIRIHRGTRILQQPVCSSDICSIHNQYYGIIRNDQFQKNPDYKESRGDRLLPFANDLTLNHPSGILRIMPYVGMHYPELTDQISVILHDSYHSGTICVNEALDAFAQSAFEKGIPFYLTGTTAHEKAYVTMQAYQKLHIHTLPDAAPIAMYCRLWLALCSNRDIVQCMHIPAGDDGRTPSDI